MTDVARDDRKKKGGRTTPKGGSGSGARHAIAKGHSTREPDTASSRYTPPVPPEYKVSPMWVPVLMFALLGVGMLIIILNYMALVPGGETDNLYLLLGLGCILGGIITATNLH